MRDLVIILQRGISEKIVKKLINNNEIINNNFQRQTFNSLILR